MGQSLIISILDLLKVNDFYYESELIDIAKGKNKTPLTFKEAKNVYKRNKTYK